MRLPYVSVGIIPANTSRYAIATIGFWILRVIQKSEVDPPKPPLSWDDASSG